MHRSRLCNVIIDCNDLEVGARFWAGALGTTVASTEGPYAFPWKPEPATSRSGCNSCPEPKTVKSRVHLDFETDDLEAEVTRLEALGARRQHFVEGWWVMEAPHGNEFCVLPRASQARSAPTPEHGRRNGSKCRGTPGAASRG